MRSITKLAALSGAIDSSPHHAHYRVCRERQTIKIDATRLNKQSALGIQGTSETSGDNKGVGTRTRRWVSERTAV